MRPFKPTVGQLTDKNAVLAAIAECDRLGREKFLDHYGFGLAKTWVVLHKGKQYDSKAIVGVALHKQLGIPVYATDFSGGEVSAVRRLLALGFRVEPREITEDTVRLPEEVPASFPEGLTQTVLVNRVERSAAARIACKEIHGNRCAACGVDFGETYGRDFEGLIHVHHLNPLSQTRGRLRRLDPAKDLRPVCPNCHAAIHWHNGLRSVEEIAAALAKKRKAAV